MGDFSLCRKSLGLVRPSLTRLPTPCQGCWVSAPASPIPLGLCVERGRTVWRGRTGWRGGTVWRGRINTEACKLSGNKSGPLTFLRWGVTLFTQKIAMALRIKVERKTL